MADKPEYEISLTPHEQRMALMEVAQGLQTGINSIKRKRSWRESERAMALYAITKRLIAVNMAIDRMTTDRPTTLSTPAELAAVNTGMAGTTRPSEDDAAPNDR